MNPEEAFQYVIKVIAEELRHDYYEVCANYADEARMLHTDYPEGQAHEILRAKPAEDYPMRERRVMLDNPVTKGILAPSYAIADSLWRVDGVTEMLNFEGTQQQEELLKRNFSTFYGRETLHEYIFNTVNHYNRVDPNAWLFCERERMEDEQNGVFLRLYPFILTSGQVIDYKNDENANPERVIGLRIFTGKDAKGKDIDYEEYLAYFRGVNFHFVQKVAEYPNGEDYSGMGYAEIKIARGKKELEFYYNIFETNLDRIPGAKIGAYKTLLYPEHVRELFVQPALGFLKTLIFVNNLINVSNVTHAFPERAQYTRTCKHENEQGECCTDGYYAGIRTTDNLCRACNGRGYDIVSSEQLTKNIPLPEDQEDLIELAKLVHYVDRPINLLEFMDRRFVSIVQLISRVIYNQELIEIDTRAPETATKVKQDWDRQYHKLLPIVSQIENFYEIFWTCGIQYYGASGDMAMTYPADLNLMSLDEYISQYKSVIDAGLSYYVAEAIEKQILRKLYRGSDNTTDELIAINTWKPFKDKDIPTTMAILASRAVDDFERQLWESFDWVRNWIRANYPDIFHLAPYKAQKEIIDEALEQKRGITKYREEREQTNGFDDFEVIEDEEPIEE